MDGALLFNKPILWTSHDAVDFIRRQSGQREVGHAGTLDPLATGLLILLLGRATKASASFMGMDKDYFGTMTFGVSTDTLDMEGRILRVSDPGHLTANEVRTVFDSLVGETVQTTPLYSAVKRGGKKLYEHARSGNMTQALPVRTITLSEFRLLDLNGPEAHFFLTCSKGTYVRALCEEAGNRISCGATLSSLARSRIGPYRLHDASGEEELRRIGRAGLEGKLRAV